MEKGKQDKEGKKRQRIVLKVGTSTLTQGTSRISRGKVEDIAIQINELKDEYEIILVSSGAIAAAKQFTQMRNAGSIGVKQALAAIGQVHLMRIFQEVFSDYNLPVSQCLLSYHDFSHEDSKQNITNTIETLLQYGYLPVINENDTVATDEIQFGDNDKLAALTATLCNADLLVLATDTEGLFNVDPKTNSGAILIPEITDLSPMLQLVSDSKSAQGSGGMKSKLEAARIAQLHKIPTWIIHGSPANFLIRALNQQMKFTKVLSE